MSQATWISCIAALGLALGGTGSRAVDRTSAAPAFERVAPLTTSDARLVRGVTVSCQTNGREWGTDAFAAELDELVQLGVNWVAIHPYARVADDGTVSWRGYPSDEPPPHLVRPIREAHARGLSILVIPHLAYWGSRFRSRNQIEFERAEDRARFWRTYRAWITALGAVVRDADAYSIGNETDRLLGDEAEWRGLIADLRTKTSAKLVYAANWSDFERVPFWDALDALGVQAYFPLSAAAEPSDAELDAAWAEIAGRLRALHERTGKPVVFTELGYPCSLAAAREPWSYQEARGAARDEAGRLQRRCLAAALRVLDREREWLRGAFLWKWFVGEAPGENFVLDRPELRDVISAAWRSAR
ncbi:MAG: hypothetical protein L6Q99_08330 [Planctomycetes bacterium]|nr:hypothetical protein [Planctomycetota bacterium]